jgi:hypothetical protein
MPDDERLDGDELRANDIRRFGLFTAMLDRRYALRRLRPGVHARKFSFPIGLRGGITMSDGVRPCRAAPHALAELDLIIQRVQIVRCVRIVPAGADLALVRGRRKEGHSPQFLCRHIAGRIARAARLVRITPSGCRRDIRRTPCPVRITLNDFNGL